MPHMPMPTKASGFSASDASAQEKAQVPQISAKRYLSTRKSPHHDALIQTGIAPMAIGSGTVRVDRQWIRRPSAQPLQVLAAQHSIEVVDLAFQVIPAA